MARIGVCDDNEELSLKIASLIREAFLKLGSDYRVEAFTDGETLLGQNMLKRFDVLFLDIDMPGVDGFDVARALRENFSDCLIVFVTSHSELVFDSLDFQPFNFLRKNSSLPLSKSIPRIVEKLAFQLRQDDTVMLEDKNGRTVAVRIRDIICVESCGHYLNYTVFQRGSINMFSSRGMLGERQEFFEGYSFVRAHKGFLINLAHVQYINSGKREVGLTGGVILPLGKLYKNDVVDKYGVYLRRKS